MVRRSYDLLTSCPWIEWLHEHDVSFEDGAWLSDRKDSVPEQAKEYLLGDRVRNKEVIGGREELFRKIGLLSGGSDQLVPVFGYWKSKDEVYVRIVTALIKRRGKVGHCTALAKKPGHELWLPTFASDGCVDSHSDATPYEPFIWEPEKYPLGIDEGDKLATRGAAARPRLGIDLACTLGISSDEFSKEWHCADGTLALRSQVWGGWEPDPNGRQQSIQNEGVILWASPKWLDQALSQINRSLVYSIKFSKYKSRLDNDDASGVNSVYVGLRSSDKPLRLWYASKASKS